MSRNSRSSSHATNSGQLSLLGDMDVGITNPANVIATVNHIALPDIPALNLPLKGIHLIEASAGTGKTWTLTALMVRLIVQGGYLTRHIIATTFTRAAAAELKLRIRSRFEEVAQLLKRAIEQPEHTLQQVQQDKALLEVFLLQSLGRDNYNHAYQRLRLALDSFDELFVGTLDSLCQRLLHEFAFDIGQYEQLSISEQSLQLSQQVMHDYLRQWRSQQDSRLIELLVLNNQLADVEDYQPVVSTALNFLSAQIQPVTAPEIDWQRLEALEQEVQQLDVAELLPYLHEQGAFRHALNKAKSLFKTSHVMAEVVDGLRQGAVSHLMNVATDKDSLHINWLTSFDDNLDAHFTKANAAIRDQFLALPSVAILCRVCTTYQYLTEQLRQMEVFLQFDIIRTVRERLPQLLSEKGETTFSEQMRLLASRLHSEQGKVLAQLIQHRYPVALVDEFQDTNSDQDAVIASIWRQPAQPAAEAVSIHPACLVLVGDPKQAIYGFRGGDMLTYQRARQIISQQGLIHTLGENQRSIAPLVQAVDRFFRFQPEMGEGVLYQPVQASGRKKSLLSEGEVHNPAPLRLIALQDKQDELQQTAWQIAGLLQQAQQQQLLIKLDEQPARPLQPNDIAVLGRKGKYLDQIEKALSGFGIPVWRTAQRSVFEGGLAQDVAALMQVMLNPYQESLLRRAVSGVLMNFSLNHLLELDEQPDELAALQASFYEFGAVWQRQGFLAAWQQLLTHFSVWQQLSTQPEGERLIVNLRHITELLHQQSEKIKGQHHLLAWLMRQVSQPGEREWEVERRLSGQQGIQLMTIHKSKGLEFPIVFVPALDMVEKPKDGLIFFEQDQQRMLGVSAREIAQQEAHNQRFEAEQRRLVYVALTRASVRLYITVKADSDKPKATVLRYWLPQAREQWIDHRDPLIATTSIQPSMQDAPDFHYQQQDDIQPVYSRPLPGRPIQAWGETSFSKLVNHSQHQQPLDVTPEQVAAEQSPELVAIHDDEPTEPTQAVVGEVSLDIPDTSVEQPIANPQDELENFRFIFPRGANAGDCLHQILEKMNPRDERFWPETFDRILQQFAINRQLQRFDHAPASHAQMTGWFRHILHASLPQGATLAGLQPQAQVHEFEFQVALGQSTLNTRRIHQLLLQYGVQVAALNSSSFARYLHGFIDLLYEHNGRFYVADYKSNYLGDQLSDYNQQAMRDSMSDAGYWLQAALYMVALHRYLKVRLPDYQPQQHLGGAVYLYLRGMQANTASNSEHYGVLHWQPDVQLVMDLDAVLGQQGGQ